VKVLITGASGFIGSHLVDALLKSGHEVVACVRNPESAKQRWPGTTAIKADFCRDHEVNVWLPRLQGIDVVINAVGIIRETRSQTFEALHTAAPCALFKATEQAGVMKVIQVSALGADKTAFSQYHLSKRAADEFLMALDLDWTIVMPSIVYGPGAKSMAFFKAIAALPIVPLVDKGDQPVQPIHINDFTRAVLQLLEPESRKRLRIEMVGPHPIAIKEIYIQLRDWLGMGQAHFISMPYRFTLIAARIGGFMGNTPMNAEAVQMLRNGNTADVTPFISQFGFTPKSFEASLARIPSQQSDRWHAGLYFLGPLLRLMIAFLWIFTGIVSAFLFPLEQSYAMLAKAGIEGIWAPIMLYCAAATDFALGIATLMAYRLTLVGWVQIAVMVLYSVIITFSQPEQWIHPFGPVSKNLPLIIATLMMIVMQRRR
jgi:uncharacterized protein YbjT (DUF2867 family)